ncbi:MAG: hypothetical protein GPOALKHO_001345 [Sodalis sp.]|nr:MAG: hypothetical protein GPOALKHO_001345 [Sodalis sp.]
MSWIKRSASISSKRQRYANWLGRVHTSCSVVSLLWWHQALTYVLSTFALSYIINILGM